MTDVISLSKKGKKQKYDFAGLSREEYDKKRYELNKDKISQKYKEHKDEVKLKYEENKEYLKLKSKTLQTKYRNSYHLLKKICNENLVLPLSVDIIQEIKNIID